MTITTEQAAVQANIEYWQKDSAAAWDKCEDRRLEATALQARVEQLEKDAARYRWLRDSPIADDQQEWLCVGLFDMGGTVEVDGAELDAAIDAAMRESNQ